MNKRQRKKAWKKFDAAYIPLAMIHDEHRRDLEAFGRKVIEECIVAAAMVMQYGHHEVEVNWYAD